MCLIQTNYFKGHEALVEVRQASTIPAFELKTEGKHNYFSDIRNHAYHYFIDHFLLIRPLGNAFFINPPYCITAKQLDRVYAIIESFLESLNDR